VFLFFCSFLASLSFDTPIFPQTNTQPPCSELSHKINTTINIINIIINTIIKNLQ